MPRDGDEISATSDNPLFGMGASEDFDFDDASTSVGGSDRELSAEERVWWRSLNGARRYKTEMEEFRRHHFSRKSDHANRLYDKLAFTVSVVSIVFLTYAIARCVNLPFFATRSSCVPANHDVTTDPTPESQIAALTAAASSLTPSSSPRRPSLATASSRTAKRSGISSSSYVTLIAR